jgi:hypothetical protein|tara:strand:- start:8 stop:217 length:210 start_codon:yes stop_codon:yes gene_type:complete
MATVAKVTIQMVDVDSPFLNTSIVEIDEIPMDNVVHSNLIQFLLEAKQPQEDKNEKPAIVIPEEKSNGK